MAMVTGAAAHSTHDYDHNHEHHEHRRLEQRTCGSTIADNEVAAQAAFDKWLALHPCTKDSCPFVEDAVQEDSIQIDVVWHDIRKDDGSEGSTTTMINSAIDVLNLAYDGTGFSFSLVATTVTSSTTYWGAEAGSEEELAMKSQLRTGDCSTLNIYSNGQTTLLGWARFPSDCALNTILDGVVITYQSSPGGNLLNYNLGDTLTHGKLEVVSEMHARQRNAFLVASPGMGLISSLKVSFSKRWGIG
jgi:hypothetical protein